MVIKVTHGTLISFSLPRAVAVMAAGPAAETHASALRSLAFPGVIKPVCLLQIAQVACHASCSSRPFQLSSAVPGATGRLRVAPAHDMRSV